MADTLNEAVDDAVDALKEANRVGKRKSDRGIAGALQNGIGLIAVRLCIFFMAIIMSLAAYIINDKVERITGSIERVNQKVDKFGDSLEAFIKDAAAERTMDRIDIIRLQDRLRTSDQQAGNPPP